jgi:3-isopropylmalate/(R)-2-methylmalate dehydratase large subunit
VNITEKILAAHAGQDLVQPGEIVSAKVDLVFAHDLTTGLVIKQLKEMGVDRVFDPTKVVIVLDHFTPAKDQAAAEECKKIRKFARERNLVFFEPGHQSGIGHVILPEQGLVLPGDLVAGADSHTCTYGALGAFATGMGSTDIAAAMATGEVWLKVPESIKLVYHGKLGPWLGGKDLILHTLSRIGVAGAVYASLEFTGPTISDLVMDDRFTMANMAIEAGAKAGIFVPDNKTRDYLAGRIDRNFDVVQSDAGAAYAEEVEFDIAQLEPQVALPHSPANSVAVSETEGIQIDQIFIGSCTNGRLSDLALAAQILKSSKIHPYVRCIVIPGSQAIYREAMRKGYLDVFIQSGAMVSTPSCGPCVGGHMGVLADGERCVSTSNRNFIGRMGSPRAEIYLAGPAVAAACAVAGKIVHPGEVVNK